MRYEEMEKLIDRERAVARVLVTASVVPVTLLVVMGRFPFNHALAVWAACAFTVSVALLVRVGLHDDLSVPGRRVLDCRKWLGYAFFFLSIFVGLFVRTAPDIIRQVARVG